MEFSQTYWSPDPDSTIYEASLNVTYDISDQLLNSSYYGNDVRWPTFRCESLNYTNISGRYMLYNNTRILCLEHAPTSTKSSYIRGTILTIMAVLSLVGNFTTMISIKRGKRARRRARPSWTAVYSLIFELSVADLLVSVFCIAGEAAWSFTVEWYAGNIACKLFKFAQMFSLYLSTFILVLIGVDRWLAVRFPMKSMDTAKRSGRLVGVSWFLSFMFSLPQVVVFHVAKGPFVEDFYQCVTHGFYTQRWQEQLYTSMTLVFMFLLPLVVLVCTYVSTVRTIARSEKVFRNEIVGVGEKSLSPDLNRKRLIHRAKMKSLRISVVIVVAFIVWWTPYYVMMIIFIFLNPDQPLSEDLQSGIFFFGMSNSLVNPVIYGAFHLWPSKRKTRRGSDRDGSTGQLRSTHASILRRGDQNSFKLKPVKSQIYMKCSNGNGTTTTAIL